MDKSKVKHSIDVAFLDSHPSEKIHSLLKNHIDNGYSHEFLIETLKEYMLELREKGEEEKEDFVTDSLDLLTGWGILPENSLKDYGKK